MIQPLQSCHSSQSSETKRGPRETNVARQSIPWKAGKRMWLWMCVIVCRPLFLCGYVLDRDGKTVASQRWDLSCPNAVKRGLQWQACHTQGKQARPLPRWRLQWSLSSAARKPPGTHVSELGVCRNTSLNHQAHSPCSNSWIQRLKCLQLGYIIWNLSVADLGKQVNYHLKQHSDKNKKKISKLKCNVWQRQQLQPRIHTTQIVLIVICSLHKKLNTLLIPINYDVAKLIMQYYNNTKLTTIN